MNQDEAAGIRCTVTDSIFLGMNTHCLVALASGQVAEIIHESAMDSPFKPGDAVFLSIKTDKINVFSKDGTRNLTHAN